MDFFFIVCYISYLVAATGLQSLWSLSLAIIDIHALLVRRSLQNYRVVSLFTIGDGVRCFLFTVTSEAKRLEHMWCPIFLVNHRKIFNLHVWLSHKCILYLFLLDLLYLLGPQLSVEVC